MKHRDKAAGWVSYFLTPSKLTKSKGLLCALISSIVFWIAFPGGGATGAGFGIAPVIRNRLNVFWAAPVKLISTFRGTLEPGSLKAPPPYVKTGTAIVHRSQEKPSSCCTAPPTVEPSPKNCNGGTTGTAPGIEITEGGAWAWGGCWNACTRVDVWTSEKASNPQRIPTINDPNATVTLFIHSPSTESNCSEWIYH